MTIDAAETYEVDKSHVACDGGGEHPRVWLQILQDKGMVACPYCEARYVLKDGASAVH